MGALNATDAFAESPSKAAPPAPAGTTNSTVQLPPTGSEAGNVVAQVPPTRENGAGTMIPPSVTATGAGFVRVTVPIEVAAATVARVNVRDAGDTSIGYVTVPTVYLIATVVLP
jgi:hypothetical protein